MRRNAPAMFQPCVGSQPKKRDINPVGLSQFVLNPAFQLLLPLVLLLILLLFLILSVLLILFLLLISLLLLIFQPLLILLLFYSVLQYLQYLQCTIVLIVLILYYSTLVSRAKEFISTAAFQQEATNPPGFLRLSLFMDFTVTSSMIYIISLIVVEW